MVQNTGGIDALLQEERSFPPPADFAAKANMADPDIYAKAAADPGGSGPGWPRSWTGSRNGTRCWTGAAPPSPSGSLAAS